MNRKLKFLAVPIAIAALLLTTAGSCEEGDSSNYDVKGVEAKNPDKIEGYANIDGHPNIVRLCIGGVAFATTSREAGLNFLRVPEWDVPFCGGKPSPYYPQIPAGADARPTSEAK